MTRRPSNIFDLLASDHQVKMPVLPVTRVVRVGARCLYAIHDNGLVGSSECLWVGKTDRPFERIYEHLASRDKGFWSRARDDTEARTDPADGEGGSNYLNENLLVSVAPVEDPSQLEELETIALGRLAPRYNEQDRYTGGYHQLDREEKALVNGLVIEPLVPPKVGGTYALISLGVRETPIQQGECLKVGETRNLNSRLTDHVRNTVRESCLRYKIEDEFPDADLSAPGLRSDLALTFAASVHCEDQWEEFFSPRYPEKT